MKKIGKILFISSFFVASLFLLASCGDEVETNDNSTPSPIEEAIKNYDFLWNDFENCSFTYEKDGQKHSVEAKVEKETKKAASCLEDGLNIYTATVTVDGKDYSVTKEEKVEALGHEWDYQNGSFVVTDLDHVDYLVKCKHDLNHEKTFTCSKELLDSSLATPNGHGYEKYKYSVVIDNKEYSYEYSYDLHYFEHVDSKEASCEEAGNIEYYHCPICDKYFDLNRKEIQASDTVIRKTGHNYDYDNPEWDINPSVNSAYVIIYCKNDDSHKKILSAQMTLKESIEPQNGQDGYKLYECVCNLGDRQFKTEYRETIAHEHNYSYHPMIEASCTNAGNIAYYTCDDCGKYFNENYVEISKEDTIIKAKDHTFTHIDQKDPTYLETGILEHKHCSSCDLDVDMEGNVLTDVTIPKYTDLGLKLNGAFNSLFTKVSEDSSQITWTLTLDLAKDDLIELILGRDGQSFSYFVADGTNLSDEFKVINDAESAVISVIYTLNGFSVSVSGLEELGVYVVVNDSNGITKYPMTEVSYSYGTQTTSYVFGYWYFEEDSIIYISDTINGKEYGFDDLDESMLWKTQYFKEATDGNIQIVTTDRLGIEFSVNGNEKILINSVFTPMTVSSVEVELKGETDLAPLTATEIKNTDAEYSYLLHTLTHDSTHNASDILDYINTNGLWTYYTTLELTEGSHIQIVVNGNQTIGFKYLDAYTGDSSYQISFDTDDYIVVSKSGTYIVGYYPAFGTVYLSSFETDNSYKYLFGGETYSLAVSDNLGVIENVEISQYGTVCFLQGTEIIKATLDSSVPATLAYATDGVIMFYKAGTYNVSINLTTNVVSIEKLDEEEGINLDGGYALNSKASQFVRFVKISDNVYKASGVSVTAQGQSISFWDSSYNSITGLSLDSESSGYMFISDMIYNPAIGTYDITVDVSQMTIHIEIAA